MHLSPDLADEKRTSGVKSRGQECSDRWVGMSQHIAGPEGSQRGWSIALRGWAGARGMRPLLDPGTELIIRWEAEIR